MTTDEQAFRATIDANPVDEAPHLVFADWLDEHDRPEEADRQRKWIAAVNELSRYSRAWDDYSHGGYATGEDGEEDYDRPLPPKPMDKGGHDQIVQEAGHWAKQAQGKDSYFGPDPDVFFGTDEAQELMSDANNRGAFFDALYVVTGVKAPDKLLEQKFFRCAC